MTLIIDALPKPVCLDLPKTALIMIDMQRDFLEARGFGEALGNDVSLLAPAIKSCHTLLEAARDAGLVIVHTREGHLPDLSDLHQEKQDRCRPGMGIGDQGLMGRILIRGEPGHDFIKALYPLHNENIIDKPGKGAFYNTKLATLLEEHQITTLLICGVTTEVCVQSTVREANDRGYRVIVPADCCASYFPAFHMAAIEMISSQGGIFGYTCESAELISALHKTGEP